MKKKQKWENHTAEIPIVINDADSNLIPQVTEATLTEDVAEVETAKKLKEKTEQCYINHI